LRATSSWAQVGGVELINFPNLVETLITYTSKAELCYLAIEVIFATFNNLTLKGVE